MLHSDVSIVFKGLQHLPFVIVIPLLLESPYYPCLNHLLPKQIKEKNSPSGHSGILNLLYMIFFVFVSLKSVHSICE